MRDVDSFNKLGDREAQFRAVSPSISEMEVDIPVPENSDQSPQPSLSPTILDYRPGHSADSPVKTPVSSNYPVKFGRIDINMTLREDQGDRPEERAAASSRATSAAVEASEGNLLLFGGLC